jgi:hypothetical protein
VTPSWPFDAYSATVSTDDAGPTYILVYGVLQALIVQQDAVRHLAEGLGLPFSPDPLLQEIREVRNSSVGHPTKRRGDPRSHFISRISLSKKGFQLMTVYPDHGPAKFTWVDIAGLIASQRRQLAAVLWQVRDSLRKAEAEHRAMFRDSKLAEAFPSTMGYYFEKLYESIHGTKPAEFGRLHVHLLAEAIGRFRALLATRGSAGAYDSVEYHLKLVEYPLRELDSYFASPSSSRLNKQDAFIFVHFAENQMNELRDMAAEIDESYQGDSGA